MIPENVIEEKKREDESNNLDRRKVSEDALTQLETDISNIDDDAAQSAIQEIAHIVTGDDRFE
jgi:hypothetical protein